MVPGRRQRLNALRVVAGFQVSIDGRFWVSTEVVQGGIRGSIATVSEDTLHMVDRQGGAQILRREEVREVRLDHRFSTGHYLGFGLLLGGVTGLVLGRAGECEDCELRGLGTALGAIFGTGMGAFGGWAIGSARNAAPGRLIYRRVAPSSPYMDSSRLPSE